MAGEFLIAHWMIDFMLLSIEYSGVTEGATFYTRTRLGILKLDQTTQPDRLLFPSWLFCNPEGPQFELPFHRPPAGWVKQQCCRPVAMSRLNDE